LQFNQFSRKSQIFSNSFSISLTSHRHLSKAEQAKEGISAKSLRLSVGIEDPAELEEDILQALGTQ
jgi:cystathionine beta-lyase/cystathionine gamma-synthase